MKTSLIETKWIDDYLNGTASEQDSALLEARLLLESALKQKIKWQKHTNELVQLYGRKKLRAEIEAVHRKLFQEPEYLSFRQRVYRFFSGQ